MKRMFLALGASALLVGSPVVLPDPVQAEPATDSLALCRDVILPNTPEANLGECMSFFRTSQEGFYAHLCDVLRELEPDVYAQYDNFGDCVREQRAIGPE